MKSFSFHVGVPDEDALFLLSGFSDPHYGDDTVWRNTFRVFTLQVPSAASGPTQITLRMRFVDPSFTLAIRWGDETLGTIKPQDSNWDDHSLTLKNSPAAIVTLSGEFDRDPYEPPFPKLDPNRSWIDLERVTVESADGADITLPAELTRKKISQTPIHLRNFRKSANKVRKAPAERPERTVYFGDIHVHTNYSACGRPNNGTVEENVALAKERGHDFIAFADHCEHMDLDTWNTYFDEIEQYSKKYDIVIIPATEWTSRDHGHRNIYFLQKKPPYLDYFIQETNDTRKLGAWFGKHDLDAFAVPHHFPYVFQSGNIDSITPEVEPLMEIYSSWGSSECYGARLQDTSRILPGCTVKDALARGLKLGFVGGGDVHNNVPGDGGITAVLAEELTLEAVFSAMRNRLCYATAGDCIMLDFHINGFPMGSVLQVNPYSIDKLFPIDVRASAVCPAPVERMELLCNGEVVYTTTHRLGASKNEMTMRPSYEKLCTPNRRKNLLDQQLVNHSRHYYVRVIQNDGGMAWSSPIWIDFKPPRD